jgi:hypothetical protein
VTQGPGDYLLRFLVPKWNLQFNQQSLISYLTIQPAAGWLTQIPHTEVHQRQALYLPPPVMPLFPEVATGLQETLASWGSNSCIGTLITDELAGKCSPICFTLASSKPVTLVFGKGAPEKPRLCCVKWSHTTVDFLLNQRHKSRKLPLSH